MRNLWRVRRRTWLTSGGVAFAVFIMVFAWSMQVGSFTVMIDNATSLLTGHLQVKQASYVDDPSVRNTLGGARRLLEVLDAIPGVRAAAPRAVAYALVSGDDRSFGAQVMGVDPDRERRLSDIPDRIAAGRYLSGPSDAVVGVLLARNLAVGVGDELVILGSTKEGGVAALAVTVAGLVETAIDDLDRTLLQVDLGTFQDAFGLEDEVHLVAVNVAGIDAADTMARRVEERLPPGIVVETWSELMPELEQMVSVKQAGQRVFFAILALLMAFSVFNTFAMTVYERTRELGMLLAVGMRPGRIIVMLQLEATLMCLLGIGIGALVSVALIGTLGRTGIPLGDVGEVLRQYHMPERIYPTLATGTLVIAPLLMFVAVQVAALIPTLRIRRLRPVDALRVAA